MRVAFIVTHPVQYYVPLYRRLAARPDWTVRVFFTAHGGEATHDAGFGRTVAWDVPLRDGYDAEVLPNRAPRPGPDRFWGVRNHGLAARVLAWRPEAVVLTGYAYAAHLAVLWRLSAAGVPVVFRGDSHLLDRAADRRWPFKRMLLRRVYARCSRVLYVGAHNRRYFEACSVPPERLAFCPHSIDVARFAEPEPRLSDDALAWRRELGVPDDALLLLFAGKFEPKKAPVELMKTVAAIDDPRLMQLLVGNGELDDAVARFAAAQPTRFRVLPFQNQSRMPMVYRMGDLFVLPSLRDETWGLAVNEALASGRPVLVSDHVGGAPDLVQQAANGFVFPAGDWHRCAEILRDALASPARLIPMRTAARAGAAAFDIAASETALVAALEPLRRAAR